MAIYIKKNNQLGQTTALMSNKNIKSIYVKQGNEDAVCVWGEGVGQIPFYYPASPECPSIYTVDKIKASTNERETLFTNPQEAGVVLVNPGDTLKIRFYSQWYQNPGSKIKQENQTAYVSKTNSSEEYSFVVQSGQGAVRLETSLGAEKSASCTITAPDKTWGRGIDSFAINVISRKGIANSHTINENKTINLWYGDQVNVANIVYPNEGYNQPIILLNGFTNNRVEGLSLSVSVSRNPKKYSVVKQFTGQNVAWRSPSVLGSTMIGDEVYYDDEIAFRVWRNAGYDSPTVNITNGSGGATITPITHSKDSSVINEFDIRFVVKGAVFVTIQGGAEVEQTTITLNVTMTEHINNAKVIVYNIYQNTSRTITVTPGSYEISGRSIVYIEKTSRVTGYKPIYTNNQKSPATGSMTLHISEEAGIARQFTIPNSDVQYEVFLVKGEEQGYRDNNAELFYGQTNTVYDGETVYTRHDHHTPYSMRAALLKYVDANNSIVCQYYCVTSDYERYFNSIPCYRTPVVVDRNLVANFTVEEKETKLIGKFATSTLDTRGFSTAYVFNGDYKIKCKFTDKRGNKRDEEIPFTNEKQDIRYSARSTNNVLGPAIRIETTPSTSYNYAVEVKVKLVSSVYVNGKAEIEVYAHV